MRSALYKVTCECCSGIIATTTYSFAPGSSPPVLPKAYSTIFGIDLCHPCDIALKAAFDNLKKERADVGFPRAS